MKSVVDFIKEDLIEKGVANASDIYIADFEMIKKPRGSKDNPATSIISGGVVNYADNKEESFNVKLDSHYSHWQIRETCKLLNTNISVLKSGIEFPDFYAKLKEFVGDGVLVVWGDYDDKVLDAQCARHRIEHTIKVVNIQASITKYFNNQGAVRFQYHENGMNLPLRKVYTALTGNEADTTHNPLTDAKQLRDVIKVILTNENGVMYLAINTILLQTLYLFNKERIDLYMTHQIKMNVAKLVGHEAKLEPEFITKGTVYENKFQTYQQLLLQLADDVRTAEMQHMMDNLSDEDNIDLSEFGPVDEFGDPLGW